MGALSFSFVAAKAPFWRSPQRRTGQLRAQNIDR
jgi:hypothetical protein